MQRIRSSVDPYLSHSAHPLITNYGLEMKIYKFCIAVYLSLFIFKVNGSCWYHQYETFVDGKVVEFGYYSYICAMGTNLEFEVFSTNYGKFDTSHEARTYFEYYKSSGGYRLSLLHRSEINYAIIKSLNTNERMLFVSPSFTKEVLTDSYVYREKYLQYDLECFHQTRTNMYDFENDIKIKFKATLFKNSGLIYRCIWFATAIDASISIHYNSNKDLSISLMKRNNKHSYYAKSLKSCSNSMNLPHDNVVNKNIFVLSSEQRYFCMNDQHHMIETMRRRYTDTSETQWNEYCSYKDDLNSKFCIHVGDDFEYALISADNHLGSTLVISHKAYQTFLIDPASASNTKTVNKDSIVCVNSQLVSSNPYWNLIASIHRNGNQLCIIPTIFYDYGNTNMEYQINGQTKSLIFHVCPINKNIATEYENTIKFSRHQDRVCLPLGYTVVRYMRNSQLNYDLYTYHDRKICGIKLPRAVCYYFEIPSEYAFIGNKYNENTKLLYRAIHNDQCLENYFYDRVYYKYEVICIPHSLLSDVSQFKDKNYVHIDGTKAIFIVTLMNSNDKITLKPTQKVGSSEVGTCHWNEVIIDLTQTRTKKDNAPCDRMYKDDQSQALQVFSNEILDHCMRVTCSKPLYYYSFEPAFDNAEGNRNIIESINISTEWIDLSNSKSMVYKIQRSFDGKLRFVSSEELLKDYEEDQDIIYDPDYYKNEFFCFQTTKIQGGSDPNIFQLTNKKYSCSIVNELKGDTIKINVQRESNCINEITLHKNEVRPVGHNTSLTRTCQYLLNRETQPQLVDPSSISVCIAKTCSKIIYVVDISMNSETVEYPITHCEQDSTGQSNCLKMANSGAIFKVANSNNDFFHFIYTKELSTKIPPNYYYNQSYGPNKLLCFDPKRISNEDTIKATGIQLMFTNQLCIIVNELPKNQNFTEVQIRVFGSCIRNISLFPDDKIDTYKQLKLFEKECDYLLTSKEKIIRINTTNTLRNCIVQTCTLIHYVIDMSSSSQKIIYPVTTCTSDNKSQNECLEIAIKRAITKVSIPRSDGVRYLNTSELNDEIPQNYYYNQFYGPNNLVCFDPKRISNLATVEAAGIQLNFAKQFCLIVNELSNPKIPTEVQITVFGSCNRTISLFADDKIDAYKQSESFARECEYLFASQEKIILINTPNTLQNCIFKTCTLIHYVIDMSSSSQKIIYPVTTCNNDQESQKKCLQFAINGAIMKVSTPRPDDVKYLYTTELNDDIPSELYYSLFYGPNQIVCFNRNKFVNYNTVKNAGISVIGNNKICVLVDEVKDGESKMEVELNVYESCNVRILLSPTDTTGAQEANQFESTCEYILKPDKLISNVNPITSKLTECITKSCIEIIYVFDISSVNEGVTYAVTRCNSDATSQTNCLNIGIHGAVMKLITPRGVKYIFTKELKGPILQDFYYEPFTGPNQMIIFNKTKVMNLQQLSTSGVQIEFSNMIGFLIDELPDLSPEITVKLNMTTECSRDIQLSKRDSFNAKEKSNAFREKCYYLFGSDQSIRKADPNTLQECIVKTCTKIDYVSDISAVPEKFVYSVIPCKEDKKSQENCLKMGINGALMKVTTSSLSKVYFLYTKKLTSAIPPNYFYKQFYGPNKLVCFDPQRISNPEIVKDAGIFLNYPNQLCLLVDELSNPKIPTEVQIPVFDDCKRTILLFANDKIDGYQQSEQFARECDYVLTSIDKIIHINPSTTLEKCIVETCTMINYVIDMSSSGQKVIYPVTKCTSDQESQKECLAIAVKGAIMKVSTPRPDGVRYIHTIELNEVIPSELIYSFFYGPNQIVCFNKNQVVNIVDVTNRGVSISGIHKICVLVDELKDLESTKMVVELKLLESCNRQILLSPADETGAEEKAKEFESNCAQILESDDWISFINQMKSKLTECITKYCIQILYIVDISPEQEKVSYEVTRCADSAVSQQYCLNTAVEGAIMKLNSPWGVKYIFTKELKGPIPPDFYYEPFYGSNQIIFFQKDRVKNLDILIKSGIQIEFSEMIGVLIDELPDSNAVTTVELKMSTECNRDIQLSKSDTFEAEDKSRKFRENCNYLVGSHGSILKVDANTLNECIVKTCTMINYVADLSALHETFIYTIIPCKEDKASQENCLQIGIKGAIIKVTTLSPSKVHFLSTKELTSSIPQEFPYNQFYGPNHIVCFDKNRIFNIGEVKAAVVTIEYTHNLCILNDEVQNKNNALIVKLKTEGTCQRYISISSASLEASERSSNELIEICDRFINVKNVKSEIVTENIQEVKECVASLCLKVAFLVKANNEIMDCKSDACDITQADINFFKIHCAQNKKSFYIISTDAYKNEIIVSNKPRYYKSSYYAHDIVCYITKFLSDADTQSNSQYIIHDQDTTCFIPKDLSETKTIDLQILSGCTRKITLHNTQRPQISESHENSLDYICRKFNVVGNSQLPISISLPNLKQCVAHLCLKPIFIVEHKPNLGKYVVIREECDANSQKCVSDAESFEYVKLQNPYTKELFYVINSEPRNLVIRSDYFYSSPFYDSEVICIQPSRIPTVSKDLTMSNSYDLGANKCVILKELGSKTTFQIVTNGCTRDISITPKDSGDSNFVRSLSSANCKKLAYNRVSLRKVHNMTKEYLEKCMTETCSHIVSRVRIQNDKQLIHSTMETCTSQLEGCPMGDDHYDFIKIESTMFEGSRFFRNFDPSLVSKYTAKNLEMYSSQYNRDYIVCFNGTDVVGPDGWLDFPGVFFEPPRICIIGRELLNDMTLEYKITSEYYQQILIKKSADTEGGIKSNAKTDCPDFFDQPNSQVLSYESNKNNLLSCIQRTSSLVYFLVKIQSNNEEYVHKRLIMCNKHTDVSVCFNEIDLFDSVKVKSPFRKDPFYVRSIGLHEPTLSLFKNHFYQQTYNRDDFVCFHHSLLSSQDSLSQTRISVSNDVSCLVVRDQTDKPSITIKMFDKCFRTVEFSTKEFKSPAKIHNNCSLFYNSKIDSTTSLTMSLTDLISCIESTCSKISSVYVNTTNSDVYTKTIMDCNGNTDYGDATCLKDLDHYYLAKIQRGTDDAIIYVHEESVDHFDESLYDPYFYSSTYYKNEVLCVNRQNLESDSTLALIETGNPNLVCIIIKDLLTISILKLKTTNNCKKEVILDSRNPRTEIQEHSEDICKFFYSKTNIEHNILEMRLGELKQCITKTCSKIVSYIQRNDKNTTYTIDNITSCSGQYGDSDCITGEHYDFAVIVDSYSSHPLIFRSVDFDVIQHQIVSHIFDRSVYFNTEIVCLPSNMILNLKLIMNQAGVYSRTKRTCIMGSQISTDVRFDLSVDDKCNRTFFVTSDSRSVSKHPNIKLDHECQGYYDSDQTLLFQSYETIINCVAHTCASVEFINQSIIGHHNNNDGDDDDKCDKTEKGCIDQNEFTYAFVNLKSNPKQILVMSSDMKNQWIKTFDNVETHFSNNDGNKIRCFNKNSIDTPESITDAYVNHELNILCIDMKEADSQVLMTNDNDSQKKISIIQSKDLNITNITSKEIRISIYADIDSTNKLKQIFKYDVTLDVNKNENNISSIDQLENCIMDERKKHMLDPISTPNVDDLYAFIIQSNIVFKRSLVFMKRNDSGCAKYYSGIENLPSKLKQSNTKFHQLECLIVSRDTLTIDVKDYSLRKSLTKPESCTTRDDLTQKCSKMYDYNNGIIVCYKLKVDTEEDENEEDDSSHPVQVMIRNGDCFISKIIKYDRVAICNINQNGISVQIIDFDLRIKEQFVKSINLKMDNHLWVFGVCGICFIALALLYGMSRKDNSDQNVLDYGKGFLTKMPVH